ncbi:hypothetical protein M406DRAFT_70217 [Cryphonectria parasitica EP155]|uniref:Alpha/beta hydrolase fold-3 domain-containing protein n=1 Tax=Cryphonectria parasitica (strain ATCC 38755 / EP155) TaxID=660469 RepID=A0A9P4Y7F4_CRYP1|nr:uncharacterized protein M406DRAFT_70217 [Cryphonectria parasitica EP155]KAF3768121.1 hypothetical protein M406DRAFT_70217 [Cryphonectria parasitica EP155]
MAASLAHPSVAESRQFMQKWTEEGLTILGPCPPHLKQDTIKVPLPDGTTSRSIVVWPADTTNDTRKRPLVVVFHGGGWVIGGPEFVLSPARGYASLLGAIVVCPTYKYAPEEPFPAPMHSAYDIVAWLSHPENLNEGPLRNTNIEFDPSQGIILSGVSAGANLSAVVAGISAADAVDKSSKLTEGRAVIEHPVTGVFLSIPLLFHESNLPAKYASIWTSRVEHADAPVVSAEALEVTDSRLKPDYHSPWFSPINLDLAKIAGHHAPRVYFQAGQRDILRDDAVVYAKVLEEKGVAETRIDIIQNIDHAGWCTIPHPDTHSDEMRIKSLDGMAWLLGKEWDKSSELPY